LLTEERSDKEEDTVLEELHKGFTFNGTVLRHSKVKIAKSQRVMLNEC
jgi:molecular chaperone GrpE (heat shock protein)